MKTEDKCASFLLAQMPWEAEFRFRICIPGIDNGSAVWLECELERNTKEEAEALARAITAKLKEVEYDPT